MCCCKKLFYLGCVNNCSDEIEFGTEAATYTVLNLKRGDSVQQIVGVATGDGISFSLSELMNGYTYELWLTNPAGEKYTDGNGNDCFLIDAINYFS